MPITWAPEPAGRFAVMTVSDPYDFAEWQQAMLSIFAHPVSRPRFKLLVDRRYSEPLTATFVSRMTSFFDAHTAELKDSLAAIVVGDDAGYGMGRMTELTNPDAEIRTFRHYDEAVAWLTTA